MERFNRVRYPIGLRHFSQMHGIICAAGIQPLTGHASLLRLCGWFLAVDQSVRILRGPGEPFDLHAVHPDESGAASDGAASNVPMQTCPLVNERRRILFWIEAKDPS